MKIESDYCCLVNATTEVIRPSTIIYFNFLCLFLHRTKVLLKKKKPNELKKKYHRTERRSIEHPTEREKKYLRY